MTDTLPSDFPKITYQKKFEYGVVIYWVSRGMSVKGVYEIYKKKIGLTLEHPDDNIRQWVDMRFQDATTKGWYCPFYDNEMFSKTLMVV